MRFAVDGHAHPHVDGIIDGLQAVGAVQVDLVSNTIDLVVCGGVPNTRASSAIKALADGFHVLCPKPAITNFTDLDAIRTWTAQTGKSFMVWHSEHVSSPATLAAINAARSGRIGNLVHVTGVGPHSIASVTRPTWFYKVERSGGLLVDLASHQISQFAALTDGPIEVIAAHCGKRGDSHLDHDNAWCAVRSRDGVEGFFRVDWLSPQGLGTWGDVRLSIIGTRGSIEVRKTVDAGGLPGSEHLIIVDENSIERRQLDAESTPFFNNYVQTLLNGGPEAVQQQRLFDVIEASLRAQQCAKAVDKKLR